MWALLLPLPWLLVGVVGAGLWRRGKPGCVFIGGVFWWPQARLLETLGSSPWAAWGLSVAIAVICPLIGYLLGLRLFPAQEDRERPEP